MIHVRHSFDTLNDYPEFWQFVPERPTDGCWEWQGLTDPRGYGRFSFNGFRDRAHRWSYALSKGYIPADLVVRHTCDNIRCVRPEHLVIGTQLDNVHDALSRRRFRPFGHAATYVLPFEEIAA